MAGKTQAAKKRRTGYVDLGAQSSALKSLERRLSSLDTTTKAAQTTQDSLAHELAALRNKVTFIEAWVKDAKSLKKSPLEGRLAALEGRVTQMPATLSRLADRIGVAETLLDELRQKKEVKEIEKIEQAFFDRVEQLAHALKGQEQRNREIVERVEADIRAVKDMLKDARTVEREVEKLDLKAIRRDLDMVRSRLAGLEENSDRLAEIERELKMMKASLPVVIE